MGRPVFFRQVRIGREGRPFEVLKFRTMRDERGPDGRIVPASERVTRVGWFLRRWSLDELPQLWNIVLGDLSLVGPRPLMPHYLPYYTTREQRRHAVRPGLTGLAQVAGRNSLTWDEKLELDVRYVETWSLRQDIAILLRTVAKVARGSDVSRDPLHEGDFAELRRARLQARAAGNARAAGG
jgi:lipopolysaccharide/colanic/teichoic acid biosynthesis glycosyltransferase